jgi:hypothetical protein
MIFLVTIMTIGGMDYERREPMLNIESCWARAAERWNEIVKLHPEATGVGVGCAIQNGDPV